MICKCDHEQKNHFMLNVHDGVSAANRAVCGKCSINGYNWIHEFKLDNLRYLEELSNGRE